MDDAKEIIARRISLNIGNLLSDAAGHEIAADDILRDLDEAGYNIVSIRSAKAPPKLSVAQRSVLEAINTARPTGGNDEGWIPCFALFTRPTVRALERMKMIEPKIKNYVGQSSGQYHRITAAGRAAIFRL